MLCRKTQHLSCALLLLILPAAASLARPFVLVHSQDYLSDPATLNLPVDVSDFDNFPDSESKPDWFLDPGSWSPVFEPDPNSKIPSPNHGDDAIYYNGLSKLVDAAAGGEFRVIDEAVADIAAASALGHPHGQSVMGFLHSMGIGRERNDAKAFLHHYFAAQGGNLQSKMAMAYTYYCQEMHEKAVKLYAELAEVAVNSFLISKDSPAIEPENKAALRKSRGEDDEDFQILEYQAQKGNAGAMYKIGIFYYFGLRGVRRNHAKGLRWFSKAAEKGEARSMELLGEIYARGSGGYGVEKKNYTKAKEYFDKAAENEEPCGFYSLGVMYLKGVGTKRDLKIATKYFALAANAGQPKAFYQLAKMFHTGVGLKKNLHMAIALYKLVAERGPWSSLSRWALESYLKGDIGKAFLLYSRMAEIGYEVAQNAERHQRAHVLWWRAFEQGNEHAALLIGDAYYYGRNGILIVLLGYMHEHGLGLPLDLHLAKRYYDQALEVVPASKLPVALALVGLWIRRNHANSFLVGMIDSLPEVEGWVENVIMEEGNATILTLFVCLLTVLYLRERRRSPMHLNLIEFYPRDLVGLTM
ncbi:hypothetical protein SASPL_148462 [Salvia splendens]|uniref:SEL1 protein n=1 Tax=Salvia splendens TaxID=180675 RepID=A0A8X8Z443_SALSN|nr:hypothetical protein SASPL_148462 [Salvia splendens]